MTFADRHEAGRLLGERVRATGAGDAVVVGLARGGVVVAAEVARALGAPLDALAVRKVGHPLQPEYALGAVAPGVVHLRAGLDVPAQVAGAAAARASQAAADLDRRLHEHRPPVPVLGRTCVLVDDGLATGATMAAAVRWARRSGASRVVVAVPVGPAATLEAFAEEADAVVSVEAPETLVAVGEWYADFGEVTDAKVVALLAAAALEPL
jgi:putative phosphoribosyl transferase